MRTYSWREGSQQQGDAQEVGDFISRLAKEHEGELQAEVVVEAAVSPSSPLHSYFEWDDTAAAREYRLEQARRLIRAIVVIDEVIDTPVRAFVHVSHAYQPVQKVMSSEKLRQELLFKALADLESVQAKYAHLQELADIFTVLRRTKKKLTSTKSKPQTKRVKKARAA